MTEEMFTILEAARDAAEEAGAYGATARINAVEDDADAYGFTLADIIDRLATIAEDRDCPALAATIAAFSY